MLRGCVTLGVLAGAASLATFATGCGGSTGLSPVSYPLLARGGDSAPFTVDGWTITIDEARIGFGPLYLCASGSASSEKCETAVAEFAATGLVDGALAASQPLGRITGFSDSARTALYDFAFSWPDERGPFALPGAPDGHSAVLRVTATKAARTMRIRAELDLAPQQPRAHAVQTGVPETAQSSSLRLELTFLPAAWWSRVDFDGLALAATDDITLPPLSDTGATVATAPPEVRAAVMARSALMAAMTSTDRPVFSWARAVP